MGDSSIAMEHYDIEDSFNRMTVPKLSANFKLQEGGSSSGGAEGPYKALTILISLKNDSLITATHPYFILDSSDVVPVPFFKTKN